MKIRSLKYDIVFFIVFILTITFILNLQAQTNDIYSNINISSNINNTTNENIQITNFVLPPITVSNNIFENNLIQNKIAFINPEIVKFDPYEKFSIKNFKPVGFRDIQHYLDFDFGYTGSKTESQTHRTLPSWRSEYIRLIQNKDNTLNIDTSYNLNYKSIQEINETYASVPVSFNLNYNYSKNKTIYDYTNRDNQNINKDIAFSIELNTRPNLQLTRFFKNEAFISLDLIYQPGGKIEIIKDELNRKNVNLNLSEYRYSTNTTVHKVFSVKNDLELKFKFGKGRIYHGSYYIDAITVTEELYKKGFLNRTVSADDIIKMSRLIFTNRNVYYSDIREYYNQRVEDVLQYMKKSGYVNDEFAEKAGSIIYDTLYNIPNQSRYFGTEFYGYFGARSITEFIWDYAESKESYLTNDLNSNLKGASTTESSDYENDLYPVLDTFFGFFIGKYIPINRKLQINLKLDIMGSFLIGEDYYWLTFPSHEKNYNDELLLDTAAIINFDIYYYLNTRTYISLINKLIPYYRYSFDNEIANKFYFTYTMRLNTNIRIKNNLYFDIRFIFKILDLNYNKVYDSAFRDFTFNKTRKYEAAYNIDLNLDCSIKYYFNRK